MDATESLCAFDRLPDDTVWCATTHGRLVRFSDGDSESVVMDTAIEVSMDILPLRLLSPRRPLGFDVRYLKVNPSERLVLIAGYSNTRPHLAVVFLSTGSDRALQSELYNHVSCQGDFIFNRPGMTIRQMSWWPGNDSQFFVVLSGNCLAIYDAHSVSVPYATYRLLFSSMDPTSGIIKNYGNPMAFTFIEGTSDWRNFAVVVMQEDGSLFVLCPINVPGVEIEKDIALNLLHASMDDTISQWHRYVMSRSQMTQTDGNATIMTRSLPLNWKHTPALQGPLDGGQRSNGRGFESVQSLGDGLVAIASTTGQIRIARLQMIHPVFDRQDIRRGPPHVFILQDCHAVTATGKMEYLSKISMPPSLGSSLQLISFMTPPMIVCITDNCLTCIDWSDPKMPISVSYKNSQPKLGCIRKGRMLVTVSEAYPMQLRCEHIKDEGHGDFQSLLQSRDAVMDEDESDMLQDEESTLDGITTLRDEFRVVCGRLTDICDNHEKGIQVLTPRLEGLVQRLKTVLADTVSSESKERMLTDGYKDLVSRLSLAFKDVNISTMETTEMMRWIEDCIDHLEMRDDQI